MGAYFRRHSLGSLSQINLICVSSLMVAEQSQGTHSGGSACDYQATFVPSIALAGPGYDGQQPYVYTSPRLR
jgi:hypothetical protein